MSGVVVTIGRASSNAAKSVETTGTT